MACHEALEPIRTALADGMESVTRELPDQGKTVVGHAQGIHAKLDEILTYCHAQQAKPSSDSDTTVQRPASPPSEGWVRKAEQYLEQVFYGGLNKGISTFVTKMAEHLRTRIVSSSIVSITLTSIGAGLRDLANDISTNVAGISLGSGPGWHDYFVLAIAVGVCIFGLLTIWKKATAPKRDAADQLKRSIQHLATAAHQQTTGGQTATG